jgi:hypothetical protein
LEAASFAVLVITQRRILWVGSNQRTQNVDHFAGGQQRSMSSLQPALTDVRYWHKADMLVAARNVRYWG